MITQDERDALAVLLVVFVFKQGRLPGWASSDHDVATRCADLLGHAPTGDATRTIECLRIVGGNRGAPRFRLNVPRIMRDMFGMTSARTDAALATAQAAGWITSPSVRTA